MARADTDSDDAVEVAVTLRRALKAWNRTRRRWPSNPRGTALIAAVTELATIGAALEDALASVPWVGEDDVQMPTLDAPSSRAVQ